MIGGWLTVSVWNKRERVRRNSISKNAMSGCTAHGIVRTSNSQDFFRLRLVITWFAFFPFLVIRQKQLFVNLSIIFGFRFLSSADNLGKFLPGEPVDSP